MAGSATTSTSTKHKLILLDDEDHKETIESLDSFTAALKAFASTMRKIRKTGKDDNDEETSRIKSVYEAITRLVAAFASASAHEVEGSEVSDTYRTLLTKMKKCVYEIAADSTGAGDFISEGLLKVVQISGEKEEEKENCCAICLEGLKSGDVKGSIQHCDHSFHFVCLNKWMKRNHTCPICTFEIDQLLINGGDV